ncbi:MFS transporter [Kurthia senegalensis]|uniref:MFS transporter n=1 Tax=Kurthia senegalensis TaxID=1033740 RepID=UPI0002883AC6|nr:MFS transporter [Kurthia senegalensis]
MEQTSWWKDWTAQLSSFSRNVKLFMFGNALIQIGMGIFGVMYNLYIRELGLAGEVSGHVIAMTALATAAILVPAGLLSDRVGRKWMIIVGAGLTAVTLVIRSVTVTEHTMLIGAFLTGLAWALPQVASVPFLAENSKPKERMNLFSVHFSIVTIAGVAGNLFGGVIADMASSIFNISVAAGIRTALLVGVGIFILGLLPILMMRKPSISIEETVVKAPRLVQDHHATDFKSNLKIIVLFGIAQLVIGTGSGLVIPYLNLYFANRFDASNSYIGFILAIGSAMTAVAQLIGPMLVRKVGEVKAIIIFQYASIPFLLLTAFTTNLWIASIGFLFRQALMNAASPIQSAVAMDIVHDKYKGLANSVNQMVFQVGWASMGIPATFLVSAFGSYYGYVYTFIITSALYLTASTYFYFTFGKRFEKLRS